MYRVMVGSHWEIAMTKSTIGFVMDSTFKSYLEKHRIWNSNFCRILNFSGILSIQIRLTMCQIYTSFQIFFVKFLFSEFYGGLKIKIKAAISALLHG